MWNSFLNENPGCSYEDLASAFGPPEVFAQEMLNTLDRDMLARFQTGRRCLMRSVAVLAAGAALALCITLRPIQPKNNDIPTFIYGVEYPFFYIEDHSDNLTSRKSIQTNMPVGVILSLLDLESVSAIDDPYFRVVDDPGDPTHRIIETNLSPEVVHSLLYPEPSSEP